MSRRQNTMLSRRWAGGGADSNIIYQLYNHTCDGTAATCIDTGIKMLSQAFIALHPKIQIELSCVSDTSVGKKGHVVRCNRVDGKYPGFYVRSGDSNPKIFRVKFDPTGAGAYDKNSTINYTLNGLIVIIDFSNEIFRVINRDPNGSDESVSFTMLSTDIYSATPLVIGGSVTNGVDASGGWKEMWKGTITSLIIRDI